MEWKRTATHKRAFAAIFIISAFVLFAAFVFLGCSILAPEEPERFAFEYIAGEGGEILGNKKQSVSSGLSGGTVTAKANDGYMFVKWSDGSEWASRTDKAVDGDITVTAYFTKKTFSVTYRSDGGGKVVGASTSFVLYGESASTVIAAPDEGYFFYGWTDGVQDAIRTDTYVKENIDVAAVFFPVVLSTRYSAGEGGSVYGKNGDPPQSAEYGERVTVTAVAGDGYSFSGWSDGVTTPERTDTVTENIDVTAEFTQKRFTVEYTYTYGGTVFGECTQSVWWDGSATTVTAVPDENYEFIGWSDGVETATRTDGRVTRDIAVCAQFGVKRFTVTYDVTDGGSVDGGAIQRVPIGDDADTVTAVADEGYYFVGWSDGVETAERTDTEINNDMSVTARFEKYSYAVKYNAGAGGSITGDTEQTVPYGEKATAVEAVPDDGYYFDSWSDGLMSEERTDTVTGNITVTARFLSFYTFELNSDADGYVIRARNPQRMINAVIPETYNDLPVTEIGDRAFAYCANPLRVTIPKTVKKIGERAFSNCTWLREIDIPDNVEAIADNAFANCPMLQAVTGMRGVKAIGRAAFGYCPQLGEITLPKGLRSIGDGLFRYDHITVYIRMTVEQMTALNPELDFGMEDDAKVVYLGNEELRIKNAE